MNIIESYTALIESNGGIVTEAGAVLKPTKKQDPFLIGDKPVVLPTKYYLDRNDWDDVHPFHPYCEDVLLGQSPTFHFLTDIIRCNLTLKYSALIKDILTIATTKELQSRVANPEANKLLTVFPDAKATAIANWNKVYATFAKGGHFSDIFIGRNNTIDKKLYFRVGRVKFPIIEDDNDSTLLGASLTKKDTTGIRNIVTKLMKPVPTEYRSNHDLPYLDVLMQYYKAMAEHFNATIALFGDVITTKPIPMEWLEGWEDVARLRKRIPKLPGNAGVRIETADIRNSGVEADEDIYENIKVRPVKDTSERPPFVPDSPADRTPPRREAPKGRSILDVRSPREMDEPERTSVLGRLGDRHDRREVRGRDTRDRGYSPRSSTPARRRGRSILDT